MARTCLLLAAAVAIILALTVSPTPESTKTRIGYLTSNTSDDFQALLVNAFIKYAQTNEDLELLIRDSAEDVHHQHDQVEAFLCAGVDALVVVAVDTDNVKPIIAKAQFAGVPLVFLNRNPFTRSEPPENVYFIGSDSLYEGEAQMRYAGELLNGKGTIAIIQGMPMNESTIGRTRGIKRVLDSTYPEIEVVFEGYANWQEFESYELLSRWLLRYDRQPINAVLCNSDSMALGALKALESAGLAGIPVLGVDGLPKAVEAIQAGRMAATVLQDPDAQGKLALETAVNAIQQNATQKSNIMTGPLLTNRNITHEIASR